MKEQHEGTTTKGMRVAIYARSSNEKQQDACIEAQVRRCADQVRRRGGNIEQGLVFSDPANGSTMARPGLEALMQLATPSPPQVDAIITEDKSRLSRDTVDLAQIVERLQHAKVPLVDLADGLDTRAKGAGGMAR